MKTLVRLQSKNARIFSEGERPGTHRAIRDGIGTRRAIRDGIPAATCSLAVRGSAMRFRTSEHHVLWFRDSRSGETGPCIRVCRDELIETGSPPLQRADNIAGGSGVFRRLVHPSQVSRSIHGGGREWRGREWLPKTWRQLPAISMVSNSVASETTE